MAWRTDTEAGVTSAVRERLSALPAVERVAIDDRQNLLCIICQADSDFSRTADAARSAVESEGEDPSSWRIDVLVRPDMRQAGRVRFHDITVVHERDRNVRVRVALERDGRQVTGEACGEPGEALELRTSVAAAIDALEQLTGSALGLRLAGVKQIRAFDAELMVISLYRPGAPGQKFFGSVVVGSDPRRAAALALLNALNRLLDGDISAHPNSATPTKYDNGFSTEHAEVSEKP